MFPNQKQIAMTQPTAPDLVAPPIPTPRSFRYEERDRVGIITLTRPERFNALTFEVYRELTDFFAMVDQRSLDPNGARALVLQGEGRAFCGGGDVEDIITRLLDRDMEGLLTFTRMTGELIANMRRCKTPIVASVKRIAAGAGAVMALASDFRLMGTRSSFAFLFPQVGLCGADMGAAWLLPRVVGVGHATEILMLGQKVGAERCEKIGLCHRVIEHADDDVDAVDRAALELALQLANGAHFALRMTKKMLMQEQDMAFTDAIEAEAQAQAICMSHPDFKEANAAWLAKRPPVWR